MRHNVFLRVNAVKETSGASDDGGKRQLRFLKLCHLESDRILAKRIDRCYRIFCWDHLRNGSWHR